MNLSDKLSKFCSQRTSLINLGISGSALLISYCTEFLFQIPPCTLCIVQRFIWMFIFFCTILAFFSSNQRLLLLIIMSLALIGGTLGIYHLLIQNGFIRDLCKVTKVSTIQDFELMLNVKSGCSEKSLSFLKIPLPFFNVLGSLGCFVSSLTEANFKKISSFNTDRNADD
ncbi:MAG: hypothetical protein CK425_11280 [Parachlamydia sp.]|nr:MAG: hypothetical protein CK425_11280 [Parachlamydia sp.]